MPICGNLVGVQHGRQALPADWLAVIEGGPVIQQLATDFALTGGPGWRAQTDDQTLARLNAAYLPGPQT